MKIDNNFINEDRDLIVMGCDMMEDNFITLKIFKNPGRINDTVLLGFSLKVKHNDPLRKDCGVEKTQRFCEWGECKTAQEILLFIIDTLRRLLQHLKLTLENKIAVVYDIGDTLKDFPFTEWRIEKL